MKSKYYLKFTGKYLVRMVTLLLAVSVTLVLVSLSPVDPVQQYVGSVPNVSVEQRAKIAEYWGLNDPPVERFLAWGKSILHGDFGVSLLYHRPGSGYYQRKICSFFSAYAYCLVFFRGYRLCRGLYHGYLERQMAG